MTTIAAPAQGSDVRRTVAVDFRSLEQARELRFAISPTIRVDGRDISPEPLESECGPNGCGCCG